MHGGDSPILCWCDLEIPVVLEFPWLQAHAGGEGTDAVQHPVPPETGWKILISF